MIYNYTSKLFTLTIVGCVYNFLYTYLHKASEKIFVKYILHGLMQMFWGHVSVYILRLFYKVIVVFGPPSNPQTPSFSVFIKWKKNYTCTFHVLHLQLCLHDCKWILNTYTRSISPKPFTCTTLVSVETNAVLTLDL